MSDPLKARFWVPVGKILREWGLQGELKCLSFNPDSELFLKQRIFYLLKEGELSPPNPPCYPIQHIKPHGDYWRLRLQGFDTPEAAKTLRGCLLAVAREELPPLDPGEIYLNDLLDLKVLSPEGKSLGQVLALQALGSSNGLLIGEQFSSAIPIPYEDEFVAKVNWEARQLILTEMGYELVKINQI